MNHPRIADSRPGAIDCFELDRYEIFAEIASGGMASVHLARMRRPRGFSKLVAVKRLLPHRAQRPRSALQLLDEARMAARISHPNVVSTLDIVAGEREVLLVMEYVHGVSLARLSANSLGELIPVPIAVAIIIDGLHGLHAAHEATTEEGTPMGLVHRDVSPQNLMVGADGITKVADFGIAKAIVKSDKTTQNVLKGKLGYMAPEQVQSLPQWHPDATPTLSRRTDVFAASISLWEVLTGRRLFKGESQAETVHNIMAMPIPPPSEFRPEVSTELDRVVLKGLERKPHLRYQSAREMALELERVVPPVRASQVAECVVRLAGPILEARRQLIAEIEGGARSTALEVLAPLPDSTSDFPVGGSPGADTTTSTQAISAPSSSPWGADYPGLGTDTAEDDSALPEHSALPEQWGEVSTRVSRPSGDSVPKEKSKKYVWLALSAVLLLALATWRLIAF